MPDAIDRLYQLHPNEFTAERNALAKSAGKTGGDIRSLQKPSIPAWAVNQVYWRRRDVYDALIEAANDLRATHKAVLAGRNADLRSASRVHEEAVDAALKAALAIMSEDGQPIADATRQAIMTTLRALPGDDPPGRLSKPLQPSGFGMLADLGSLAAAAGKVHKAAKTPKAAARPEKSAKPESKTDAKADARRERAKEAHAQALRDLREAEQIARREEFEAARAARELEKAKTSVEDARTALEEAEGALREAERAQAAAVKKHESMKDRAAKADKELRAARTRADAAERAL